MKKFILASWSPRRKEILESLHVKFDVIPSKYEEDMTLDLPPAKLASFLAQGKTQDVVNTVSEWIVIGSDTLVALDNLVLGKPKTQEKAQEMLELISDRSVCVYTGICVIDAATKKTKTKVSTLTCKIKKLSSQDISEYIATWDPLDKAGSFAVQGIWWALIERIEGDFWGCVGLSIFDLTQLLKEFGVDVMNGY